MFIATAKVWVYKPCSPAKPVWFLTSCCTFSAGVTSQGMVVAVMTPLDSPSLTAGTGMPTGVAPSCSSMMLTMREPPRTFTPLKSSSRVIGSLLWIRPGPCTCTAMSLTSLNSSIACFSTYSWKAREAGSAKPLKKGSSNTSDFGKRPGV
ncbi:MAG: hypothetical protein MOGDAGHF_01159 [Rhodocyclaceae bacterium]|nr:hypothetical protein [Rhodocyclaceae bacterium]